MAELRSIPLNAIEASPHNPRQAFDDNSLRSLADSIARYGVLQPILVAASAEEGRYIIVAGERRWRASCLAERVDIPALVVELDDPILREVQLIENLEREQLNPIDEALALRDLQQVYAYSDATLAQRLKRSLPFIKSRLELLRLDERVQDLVATARIAIRTALELLRLNEPDDQYQLAQTVEEDNLTAAQTIARINYLNLEKRLAVSQASKKLSLARKARALAEEGEVITTETFNPQQHHRVWDLMFTECATCDLKAKFLRPDGQVEDVCVNPVRYNQLLAQHRSSSEQTRRSAQMARQQALEHVLNAEEVNTEHLLYLLWSVSSMMGSAADGWRREFNLPAHAAGSSTRATEWDMIRTWSDEQILTNILRLTISHMSTLSNAQLPSGLKRSLVENFGVSPEILEERTSTQ